MSASTANRVIGHRGYGMYMAPDNSATAYKMAVAGGLLHIECDVWQLSDGSLGCMHDATVDRTTSGTGGVESLNRTTFKSLTLDPSTYLGPLWGNEAPPLFQEYLEIVGKSGATMWPEAKNAGAGPGIVAALIQANIAKDKAVVQAFTQSWLSAAIDAGYKTLLMGNPATADFIAIKAAGVTMYGADTSWTDADIARAKSAGLQVVVYTVDRKNQVDALLARGVDFVFSDNPIWVSGESSKLKRDPYAGMTLSHGMLWVNGVNGTFVAPGKLRLNKVNAYVGCSQYWAGKLDRNFVINLNIAINSVNSSDRWASFVLLGQSDKEFKDLFVSEVQPVYHVIARANGVVAIYRIVHGVAPSKIAETTGAALTLGQTYAVTLSVQGNVITATCNGVTATATEDLANFNTGGYLQFGSSQAEVDFSSVVIS